MDRIFVCQRCGKKLDLHPSLTEINFEELEKDKGTNRCSLLLRIGLLHCVRNFGKIEVIIRNTSND